MRGNKNAILLHAIEAIHELHMQDYRESLQRV